MRPGGDRHAHFQCGCRASCEGVPDDSLAARIGSIVNRRTRSPIEQHSIWCALVEPFDVLVAIARQTDLDFVFAVRGKRVRIERAAPGADRQPVDVVFLRDVRPDAHCVAAGDGSVRPTASRLIFCAAEM